jgi:murein L,D-transpeptidase YafK
VKVLFQILVCFALCLQTGALDARTVPSSPRSCEAVNRVRPRLQSQFSEKNLEWGAPIFIRIFKESSDLELWIRGKNGLFTLFQTYPVCTYGNGALGPKRAQGDGQAPEGFYFVTPNRLNPNSRFHLSFDIGYPNAYDRANHRTGGFIAVHGGCASIGCFAMTDTTIEEIWTLAAAAFEKRQSFFRVHVFPFRMTDENMRKHRQNDVTEFWRNLLEGYNIFEIRRIPPDIVVRNRRYAFQ